MMYNSHSCERHPVGDIQWSNKLDSLTGQTTKCKQTQTAASEQPFIQKK